MRIVALFVTLSLALTTQVNAAEKLYTKQPILTPELALPGNRPVGVKTLTAVNPDQLDAKDFTSQYNRGLTLEVWYPGITDNEMKPAIYESVTRSHRPYAIQGTAYRDLKPVSGERFPLVVLSHGYTGYRTLMFYLGEHFASHGYVAVGIDHTDSTNADVDFSQAPEGGFPSTLLNRARDQQFVLDHFSQLDSAIGKITNTNLAAVVGYSMGGYGAINTVGGCYDFTPELLTALKFPEQMAAHLAPVLSSCNAGRDAVDPRWKGMVAIAPWGQGVSYP